MKDTPALISYEQSSIGIDLNATSHLIVVADPVIGSVQKFGRQVPHLKKKYRDLRRKAQSKGCLKLVRKLGRRERNKTIDVLRKAAYKIVIKAKRSNCSIKVEDLKRIRKGGTQKYRSEHNHTLNSWPFFTFKTLLKNKAEELGVMVHDVEPMFTSIDCSRCGNRDKRNRSRKLFVCTKCSHVDHADANAAFNIALRSVIDRRCKVAPTKGLKYPKRSKRFMGIDLKSLSGDVSQNASAR